MSTRSRRVNGNSLSEILTPPPGNHIHMSPSAVFEQLKQAGDWTYPQITDELSMHSELTQGLAEDTVKKWGIRNSVPQGKYRDALLDLVRNKCATQELSDQWIEALISSWVRKKTKKVKRKVKNVQENILNNDNECRQNKYYEGDAFLIKRNTSSTESGGVPSNRFFCEEEKYNRIKNFRLLSEKSSLSIFCVFLAITFSYPIFDIHFNKDQNVNSILFLLLGGFLSSLFWKIRTKN